MEVNTSHSYHNINIGNAPRGRKKEVKLTFWKCRSEMLKKKVKKMGNL
jgi:hypothetical protein